MSMALSAPSESFWGGLSGHLLPGASGVGRQPIGRPSSPATSRAPVCTLLYIIEGEDDQANAMLIHFSQSLA
eukprot:7605280-Alexandrium_andersonii.AAC.1